ncbi:helix-turn-helix domain-containing protein [Mycobacteroides abscessus]|uniref:helix-turn-helix domain-containing protein n=2 Tax=Mycobacteroides abscessus TaxID=36809 RepID=UPI001F3D4FBA|nr:helix-turn-helix transcriptional regulator [Mycobacteroides abscessus]
MHLVMEGQLQKIVGRNLRRYRKERGLSQEAFADHVGFHRTYMGAVERGERNLTLQTVEKIADFLKIDPLALLSEPKLSPSRR